MSNIHDSKKWSFETRQIHIGQEQADPATDASSTDLCICIFCLS